MFLMKTSVIDVTFFNQDPLGTQVSDLTFLAAQAALCWPLRLIINSFMVLNYITSSDIHYITSANIYYITSDDHIKPTKTTDLPSHLTYPPICPTRLPDLPTHPDNLPEPTDNLTEPTDNLP